MTLRNYNIEELRKLDVAHHLPAQADYKELAALGGSRIITRAEGSTIYDGDGNAILDGMAGLWCVAVGYGREELAKAAYDQMLELPFYNTFFKTATAPAVQLGRASRRACWAATSRTSSSIRRARSPTTPSCAWCATIGSCKGQPERKRLHQPLECVSRLDRRRREPRRHEDDACAGRPADPRHRARDAALSLRRRLRRR